MSLPFNPKAFSKSSSLIPHPNTAVGIFIDPGFSLLKLPTIVAGLSPTFIWKCTRPFGNTMTSPFSSTLAKTCSACRQILNESSPQAHTQPLLLLDGNEAHWHHQLQNLHEQVTCLVCWGPGSYSRWQESMLAPFHWISMRFDPRKYEILHCGIRWVLAGDVGCRISIGYAEVTNWIRIRSQGHITLKENGK